MSAKIEQEFYTEKPFIGLDGVDEKGVRAEVTVTKGFAPLDVTKKDMSGEKSIKLTFDNDALNLKFPIYGYLFKSKETEKAVELATKAWKEDLPLFFRLESVRDKKIDRSLPMAEVIKKAKEDDKTYTFRRVASISLDGEHWEHGIMSTNPAEDPTSSRGGYSAMNMSDSELQSWKEKNSPNSNQRTHEQNNSAPRTVSVDPAPYYKYRHNGTVNLSGYSVNIPFNILSFVIEQMKEQDIVFSEDKAKTLAKRLFDMVNTIQLAVYQGELLEADPTLPSHTKIRSIVFEIIRSINPLTIEVIEGGKPQSSYLVSVYHKTIELWNWSYEVSGFNVHTESNATNEDDSNNAEDTHEESSDKVEQDNNSSNENPFEEEAPIVDIEPEDIF